MIEPENEEISISRQCELVGLTRSSYYYRRKKPDEEELELMRLIDEQYMERPFYGVRRMVAYLRRLGFIVNHKRVSGLMRRMGLMGVVPKRHLSRPEARQGKYPYLLRERVIEKPDDVWCADITYIRLGEGYCYLMAIMDWHSRYVISWDLSRSLDSRFCASALESALERGKKPEIFNTDQGSQFASEVFVEKLKESGVQVSMDGRGRVYDNILIERLWRSVKWEEVYLREYETFSDARKSLEEYFRFYNQERPHQSLGYMTPEEVYFSSYSKNLRKEVKEQKKGVIMEEEADRQYKYEILQSPQPSAEGCASPLVYHLNTL